MENETKVMPIYFNPEKIGASLKEVGIDYLQLESKEIETRWFRDSSGEIDIFIWFNKDKKIIKQQVSIMGLLTEWNAAEGVKTGMVFENELQKQNASDVRNDQQKTSEIIRFDKSVQPQALFMAKQLLENTTCIDSSLKNSMLSLFDQGSPIGMKLFQYGSKSPHQSLFSNILSRIKRCFQK